MTAITTFLPTMVPQEHHDRVGRPEASSASLHLGLSVIDRLVADLLLYHRNAHSSLGTRQRTVGPASAHVGQPKAGAGHLAGIPSGQRYYQIISVNAPNQFDDPQDSPPGGLQLGAEQHAIAFVRGRNYVLASPALAQAPSYGGCSWPDRDQSAHSGVKALVCSKALHNHHFHYDRCRTTEKPHGHARIPMIPIILATRRNTN